MCKTNLPINALLPHPLMGPIFMNEFYVCLSNQFLTICEMELVKQGDDYKRCSGFVEIEVLRTDKYDEVTMKISDCLGLSLQENESYALFKMNGARILDKDLSMASKNLG